MVVQHRLARNPNAGRAEGRFANRRFLNGLRSAFLAPLSAGLSLSAIRVFHRKPDLLDRVDLAEERVIRIAPTDLPLDFLIFLGGRNPKVQARPRHQEFVKADASIEAPLRVLTGIFEGQEDGDAAFFSSDLWIEGDTALVLALRNALEDADLHLADLFPLPLPAPVKSRLDSAARLVLERLQ